MSDTRRRPATRAALALAICSATWSAYLWLVGGFRADVFGLTIRSRDPIRPLGVAVVSLAAVVWLAGLDAILAWARKTVDAIDRTVDTWPAAPAIRRWIVRTGRSGRL